MNSIPEFQAAEEQPSKPAAQKRKRRQSVLIFLIAFALLVLLSLVAGRTYLEQQLSPVSQESQVQEFEILPGWGAKRVANELAQAGLIRNSRLFAYYLQYHELDTQIGEGLYELDAKMTAAELAASLSQGGRPRTVRLVIPEGFRLQDVAARVAETGFADLETLDALVHYPNRDSFHLLPEKASLEGYLFPASYDIPVKHSAFDVLMLMYQRFEQELSEEVKAELAAQELSVHDWVSLASIIQSEAANNQEMPIIAGVFRNRLDLGMLLQSDPTVAYGLGKDLPELNFAAGDFAMDHPWNTYTRPGIPYGPICNPGKEALEAVLKPIRKTPDGKDYLYFLHGFDGDQKVFRPNISLADHNRDVARYLR